MQRGGARSRVAASSRGALYSVRMSDTSQEDKRRTPFWVWMVIAGLAMVEPVTHLTYPHCEPQGCTWTGLHTVDTYAYLTAMRYCGDEYYSPYARCGSAAGDRDASLYALPHHRLYGMLGSVARAFGIPEFEFLGIANGFGLAFMLLAVYWLLRSILPGRAQLAFLLFALGGGLGGVLYLVSSVLGLHEHPIFARAFLRFFVYELNEGVRFQPYLFAGRLYYTLPLGLGFLGLALFTRGIARQSLLWQAPAAALVFAGAFLNMRLGPILWGIGILYLVCVPGSGLRIRIAAGGMWTLGATLGSLAAAKMLAQNPELNASVFRSLSGAMWLLPFLYASALHWLVVPGALGRGLGALPGFARVCGFAAAGYCVLYVVLYFGYQFAWYGNWLYGGETSAAIAVSDWALPGACAGAVLAWRRRPVLAPANSGQAVLGWLAVWFLAFFAVSVSANGGGWTLQFMPQRFMVALGLPLAALAAEELARVKIKRPGLARGYVIAIVACGLISIFVTWGIVYGPLGHASAQRVFPWTNYLFMSKADARMLDEIPQGVVLAPSLGDPLLGDVAAQRPGLRTVYGNGTMDFSREVMPDVRARVAAFFKPGTSEATRRTLVDDWCVNYVLCPGTTPVDAATIAELRALPWLQEVAAEGEGVLFRMRRQNTDGDAAK